MVTQWYLTGVKKIVFNASGSIAVQSTSKIELNTWNHVKIVGHGDDLSMFINGKLEASTTGWQSYTVTNFHRVTLRGETCSTC